MKIEINPFLLRNSCVGDKFWGINRNEKRRLEQNRKSVRVSKSISTYYSSQLNLGFLQTFACSFFR